MDLDQKQTVESALTATFPLTVWRTAPGDQTRAPWERITTVDMRKYSGEHFVKVDDVRDEPIEGQIAVVKEGKWDKPNIVLESGEVLSLNATNNQILMRAYGAESDHWVGKTIRLFLGEIEYQGSPREAVLVEPISPPIKQKKKVADDDKVPFDEDVPF